ncbi:hypothetical protein CMEL01_02748 [Colletotrichum melonis]|uniref:Uncharacterized protein n=1 Tax=Colletotrichum melonis TaxID=1209925 RepID=A0AAI9UPI4_9PEZI|nr:hypothetical protein CMEL01_02748 [Colletotrichum melonis]
MSNTAMRKSRRYHHRCLARMKRLIHITTQTNTITTDAESHSHQGRESDQKLLSLKELARHRPLGYLCSLRGRQPTTTNTT